MEENALVALLLSVVAGLATAIGAGFTFALKREDLRVFALGMSFSAGVMIYISFMEILPMSMGQVWREEGNSFFDSEGSGRAFVLLAFFIGAGLAAVIDFFVPEHVCGEDMDIADCAKKGIAYKSGRRGVRRAGLITTIALAVHNFPEGLSVFVSGVDDLSVGMFVALAIAIHNIPEGVSAALPVYASTGSRRKAFLASAFSGLTEPLGALVAYLFLMPYLTPAVMSFVLASTAGIMVYISLDELLPTAKEYDEGHYGIIGVFSGMALMGGVSIFF